jgi:hypothetical protein
LRNNERQRANYTTIKNSKGKLDEVASGSQNKWSEQLRKVGL